MVQSFTVLNWDMYMFLCLTVEASFIWTWRGDEDWPSHQICSLSGISIDLTSWFSFFFLIFYFNNQYKVLLVFLPSLSKVISFCSWLLKYLSRNKLTIRDNIHAKGVLALQNLCVCIAVFFHASENICSFFAALLVIWSCK